MPQPTISRSLFWGGGRLPEDCRPTYRRHLGYALLNSAAAGILANAPMMALKALGSPPWQMALTMTISSVGMFLVLYLGGVMAPRRKMPFVVIPGLASAATCVGMALTQNALWFLILSGLGALFETLATPAIAAIIRTNYPAAHRGAATGSIRGWCSLAFLLACVSSAWLLDHSPLAATRMIQVQLFLSGGLWGLGIAVFATIRVKAGPQRFEEPTPPIAHPLREAWGVCQRDSRFRRYLGIGLLYSFGGMVFASFIPVLVTQRLQCAYLASTLLVHGIPGIVAFGSTGWLGRWIDRTNPWQSWRWVRLGWGLDPLLLALTPTLLLVSPWVALAVAGVARLARGVVMGASWILWWQVGVSHFAAPGADTARYQGMALFAGGFARLLAPIVGAWVLQAGSLEGVFVLGSCLVLLSALLSSRELAREKHDARFATIERFEETALAPSPRPSEGAPSEHVSDLKP